jgi:perosamine synthetase
MAVDVFGHPADWWALEGVARRHGLLLVDDSCEALGASYRGTRLGAFGAAGAFAFYPNKQITTGEGGMVVTGDANLARLCRSFANQGREDMGAWLTHGLLGHNYRMDEMSAALGLSQLSRLETFLAKRERVAALYTERLAALPGVAAPRVLSNVEVSRFVYVVTLEEGLDRDRTLAAMEAEGVPARGYFAPIHTQPYIRERLGDLAGTLPITEGLAKRTLALPFHNNLGVVDVEHVLAVLGRSLRAARPALDRG